MQNYVNCSLYLRVGGEIAQLCTRPVRTLTTALFIIICLRVSLFFIRVHLFNLVSLIMLTLLHGLIQGQRYHGWRGHDVLVFFKHTMLGLFQMTLQNRFGNEHFITSWAS